MGGDMADLLPHIFCSFGGGKFGGGGGGKGSNVEDGKWEICFTL